MCADRTAVPELLPTYRTSVASAAHCTRNLTLYSLRDAGSRGRGNLDLDLMLAWLLSRVEVNQLYQAEIPSRR